MSKWSAQRCFHEKILREWQKLKGIRKREKVSRIYTSLNDFRSTISMKRHKWCVLRSMWVDWNFVQPWKPMTVICLRETHSWSLKSIYIYKHWTLQNNNKRKRELADEHGNSTRIFSTTHSNMGNRHCFLHSYLNLNHLGASHSSYNQSQNSFIPSNSLIIFLLT